MRGARPLRHVDPTRRRGLVYRAWARLTATRFFAWVSRVVVWKLDPVVMRMTGHRVGLGLALPTALLETRGARTGRPRRNGVIYFHDADDVVVVASKGGAPEHPAWFHNAVAHPDVRLGGHPFRAQVVAGEGERDRLWDLADRVFPPYRLYRRRAAAAGRAIPILRLTPG